MLDTTNRTIIVILIVLALVFMFCGDPGPLTGIKAGIIFISLALIVAVLNCQLEEGMNDAALPTLQDLIRDSEVTAPASMVAQEGSPDDLAQVHKGNDKYDFLLSSQDYGEKDQLYYVSKADLIDREWKDRFTILDTKHWKPFQDRPPVCLDRNEPCAPCPVTMHTPYLDLSQFGTKAVKA